MKQEEWQLGPNSELSSTERMIAHKEWLKAIHKELKDKISNENKSEEPEILLGGFDD